MTKYWERIPEAHRVWVAIAAVMAALFLAGWRFGNFMDLPDRVDALESTVEEMQDVQKEMLRGIERTNCKLDLIIDGTPQKRCP